MTDSTSDRINSIALTHAPKKNCRCQNSGTLHTKTTPLRWGLGVECRVFGVLCSVLGFGCWGWRRWGKLVHGQCSYPANSQQTEQHFMRSLHNNMEVERCLDHDITDDNRQFHRSTNVEVGIRFGN